MIFPYWLISCSLSGYSGSPWHSFHASSSHAAQVRALAGSTALGPGVHASMMQEPREKMMWDRRFRAIGRKGRRWALDLRRPASGLVMPMMPLSFLTCHTELQESTWTVGNAKSLSISLSILQQRMAWPTATAVFAHGAFHGELILPVSVRSSSGRCILPSLFPECLP